MADNNSSFIALPSDVSDPVVLRRFLEKLVLELDRAFGNRGVQAFIATTETSPDITNTEDLKDYVDSSETELSVSSPFGIVTGVEDE